MSINKLIVYKSILLFFLYFCFSYLYADNEPKLWYDKPSSNWNEALPIGNGRMGAMVFGNPVNERLQLNEESIWVKQGEIYDNPGTYKQIKKARKLLFSGKYKEANDLVADKILNERLPLGTNTYQELGNLNFNFQGIGSIKNYHRELLLDSALVNVTFLSNGVNYSRTYFSSAKDQVLVAKFTADQKSSINCNFWFTREGLSHVISLKNKKSGEDSTFMPSKSGAIFLKNDEIVVKEHTGKGNGVKYVARIQVLHKGGKVDVIDGKLRAAGCDELELRLTCGTDYFGDDPDSLCMDRQQKESGKNYNQLLEDHVSDFKSFFNRVDLNLGSNEMVYLPTNERIEAVKRGAFDPQLIATYFQFGRYLLLSSSREGCLPPNLQGIWCEGLTPIWNSDYHININIQMNMWPTGVTNLIECQKPFLKFVSNLRENGSKVAKENYNARGFCAHHTTDVWQMATLFGKPQYGMWPFGGAWCATHYWDYYLFSGDKTILEDYGYDVMKKASLFCLDFMVKNPHTGKYVTGPSMSPENSYFDKDGNEVSVDMGPAMDLEIVWYLFTSTIKASELLNVDEKFRKILKIRLGNMAQVKIGSDGRIMEWSHEFKEAYPGHRHISHLFGLYPSNQFNWKDSPEYFDAAEKVLDYRLKNGGGHTGWSRAWIINFYARLLDSENTYKHINLLLAKSTLPNMFDSHPPFQIDGNFGGTAGIAEMLLQSHTGTIHLLPALSTKFKNGSVSGLVARGCYTVNMEWKDGKLTKAVIMPKYSGKCEIRYRDIYKTIYFKAGKIISLNGLLE